MRLRSVVLAGGARIGFEQSGKIGIPRWRALRPRRTLVLLQEIREASDQCLVAACRQDHPTPMRDVSVLVGDQPDMRRDRELLK